MLDLGGEKGGGGEVKQHLLSTGNPLSAPSLPPPFFFILRLSRSEWHTHTHTRTHNSPTQPPSLVA